MNRPKLPRGAQWIEEDGQYGIIWANRRTTPRWNETGPALAYAVALAAGTRRPEYEVHRLTRYGHEPRNR